MTQRTALLKFSGWCLMRIPTDPDPTDEPRGVSGYTFAYGDEPDLDRFIMFHPEDRFIRDPAWRAAPKEDPNRDLPNGGPGLGVYVREAQVIEDGLAGPGIEALVGAKVNLEDGPDGDGPKLENRNWLLTLPGQEPIVPFNLRITTGTGVDIYRENALDPDNPDLPVWKVGKEYLARCAAVGMYPEPDTVGEATGIWDYLAKNKARKATLEAMLDQVRYWPDGPEKDNRMAILNGRLRSLKTGIEHTEKGERDRRVFMTQMVERFSFEILGRDGRVSPESEAVLGGAVNCSAGWPVGFWIGGWDPDLLAAHVQGSLRLPLID